MNDILASLHLGETPSSSPPLAITGLRGSSAALLAARLAAASGRAVLCVVPSETEATGLEHDLGLFTDLPVFLYPGYDIPPYTPLSPDPTTVAGRLATLYGLLTTEPPFVVVAPAEALLRRTPPKELLNGLVEWVVAGEETDPGRLVGRLTEAGYEAVALVQTVGEFSVRGGIVDVFAPGYEFPLRLDFFGDTVESIRFFDPITQRSVEEVTEATLLPASDILFPTAEGEGINRLLDRFETERERFGWDYDEQGRIVERLQSRQRFGRAWSSPGSGSRPTMPKPPPPEPRPCRPRPSFCPRPNSTRHWAATACSRSMTLPPRNWIRPAPWPSPRATTP